LQTKRAHRDSATSAKPHKCNRQHLFKGYDVKHAPHEVTSDDASKNSFDDSQVMLEVRVIKNDMFNMTKHQKSKSTIEFTTKRLNFTLFPQVSVYSSSSAHSDWVHFQLRSHDDSDTESDEGSFGSTQYL